MDASTRTPVYGVGGHHCGETVTPGESESELPLLSP